MFPSPKLDKPSILILAKSGCWPRLREDLGACGQGNGLQLNLYNLGVSLLPLNQLMGGSVQRVSIFFPTKIVLL